MQPPTNFQFYDSSYDITWDMLNISFNVTLPNPDLSLSCDDASISHISLIAVQSFSSIGRIVNLFVVIMILKKAQFQLIKLEFVFSLPESLNLT